MSFLPISKTELSERGIDRPDFICVTGDAYVDHPSFGIAIISRYLEHLGFTVAMLAQPNMKNNDDFMRFGTPKYAFFVTGGNIDTMVNKYTAARKLRSTDDYSPGGNISLRPDMATIAYTKRLKEIYPDTPVVIGGLEASLRRFAHYDYQSDAVQRSILIDSGADLLSYGMGEHQTKEIAEHFRDGKGIEDMRAIRGICYLSTRDDLPQNHVTLSSYDKVREDKRSYAKATALQIGEQDSVCGRTLVQKHGESYVVQTPPSPPLSTEELDEVFGLNYMRTYHPIYEKQGGVKAIEEVRFSVMHNRGCFGNCNFCAIAFHQGKAVSARSHSSVVKEVESFVNEKDFKGYVHDVGGPTANFRKSACSKQATKGACKDKKCLGFKSCKSVNADHRDYLELLRKLRAIKGIKKVFVRSGLRFDYIMLDSDDTFLKELIEHHVSGQLKVAPEHCSDDVLKMMGKPSISVYNKFAEKFYKITKSKNKEQYLVPYLMSSHPGSTINDAIKLALYLKRNNLRPEQVQDFYPTPGTVSTAMFYTGLDPFTLESVEVARTDEEKRVQRALLQYHKPENKRLIINTLIKLKKEHLIGTDKNCLIAPDTEYIKRKNAQKKLEPKATKKGGGNSKRGGKNGKKPKKK